MLESPVQVRDSRSAKTIIWTGSHLTASLSTESVNKASRLPIDSEFLAMIAASVTPSKSHVI